MLVYFDRDSQTVFAEDKKNSEKTVKHEGLGVVSFKIAKSPGMQIPACGRHKLQSGELRCRHHL